MRERHIRTRKLPWLCKTAFPKSQLQKAHFIHEFENGKNNDGYWTYSWMACQFKDCVDCLTVLFPDCPYEFMFLFDHSCGHDKKRQDGLDAGNMCKVLWRKATNDVADINKTRASLPRSISLHAQSWRHAINEFPAWRWWSFLDDSREMWKEMSWQRYRENAEVTIHDKRTYCNTSTARTYHCQQKKKIQEVALARDILIEEEEPIIDEGWEGKPKGLLQVAWEWCFIDPSIENIKSFYTINGWKNAMGILQPKTSLKHLLANCINFEEEEIMLQMLGWTLGIVVDCTPKCHPELTISEGIEFSWGCSKNCYHCLTLQEKKRKENFINSIRTCLSREVLDITQIRKFSKWAQEYIYSYHVLWQENQGTTTGTHLPPAVVTIDLMVMLMKIGKLVKKFKTHRCELDFDYAFCKASFKELWAFCCGLTRLSSELHASRL